MFEQAIAGEQFAAIVDGGGIFEGWTGGDGIGVPGWDVDDLKGELGRLWRSGGEAASLHGGEVLAQRIHFGDGGTGGDERLVEGGGVGQRGAGIERKIEEGAAASTDEKDDKRVLCRAVQKA